MLEYLKYIKSILSDNHTKIWLWCDLPEYILKECKMILNNEDYRIYRERKLNKNFHKKFLLMKSDNKYSLIQCIYNNKTNDLEDFYKIIKLLKIQGIVYHSINYNSIKNNFIDTKINFFYKKLYPDIYKNIRYTNILNKPYTYQIDAYNKLRNQHRCILKLPCGMGKTLISMMCGLDYDQVVIVSPLKQYCKQNLDRFESEIKYLKYIPLLIDSETEGTRDIASIKRIIRMNKNVILSITYKSVDILNKIKRYLKNALIIIDEFHNLTKYDIIENVIEKTEMNKLLYSKLRILFMSATPRIFDIYDNGSLNSKIFGDIMYTYDMGLAINNKYICDYDIYLPSNINEDIEFKDIDKKKCEFMIEGCLELGAKKTIIYLHTHIEANKYKNIIIKLGEYYNIPIYVETILSVDNYNNRNIKLDKFNKFYGYSFLCSVQILDECIDIQNCDSIYITYPSNSKIRNIQRLCRTNRLDHENRDKKAKIFLWAEENNDIVEILQHLKEYDETFTIKKINLLNKRGEINKNNKEFKIVKDFVESVKKITEFEKIWTDTLNKIKKNMKLNIKLNKNLLNWLKLQDSLFKDKEFINKNNYLFNIFYNFKIKNENLFLSNTEIWNNNLNKLQEYIIKFKARPKLDSKLYKWLYIQNGLYDNRERYMKNEYFYERFRIFRETYLDKLKSFSEIWIDNFNKLLLYVSLKKFLPSIHDSNTENKRIAIWMDKQVILYKSGQGNFKDENINKLFGEFYDNYYMKYNKIEIKINKYRLISNY
jgi:hypothetical protein